VENNDYTLISLTLSKSAKFATDRANMASFMISRILGEFIMHNLKTSVGVLFVFSFLIFGGIAIGQVDISRRTTAITYPLDEPVTVAFRGTTRFPRMKGEAKIKRTSRNGTEIELSVSKMPRPFELGRGYATYILWAISPEGQVDNLGEIKRRGFFEFDSKMSVTTRLQNFALIITAEPHFLVRRPSQEIMLENLNPVARSGRAIPTMAAVQYFGNASDYFRDSRTPEIAEIDYSKTPSTILQAKQALALARFAGAERDATEELNSAEALLQTAEDAWRAGRQEESVDVTARSAISTAVKAESVALTRREAREARNAKTRTDAEMRQIEDRLSDAMSEIEDLKSQIAAETRDKELSQRDVQTFSNQIRELRAENGRLREELGRSQVEANNAKSRLAVYENQEREVQTQREREERLATLDANQPALIAGLKKYGSVVKNERGIVLTMPESFWAAIRSTNFSPNSDASLLAIGELLANNPEYRITIESHTDDRGESAELESLSQQRSKAIADRLAEFGVQGNRIEPRGMGASFPIAPNTTNARRARNRRVQMILVPTI
jgi:outer membrane protein OmpA-like peptidoglycan-associated protein